MIGTAAAASPEEVLQQGLADRRGETAEIAGLRSEALDDFSTHPIRRLYVTLRDGQELTAIWKRLERQPDRDPAREVVVYERVLAGRRHGAPELYASCSDAARGRHWLFLEDVGPRTLDWYGKEKWLAAFRWLARMHASSLGRAEELQRPDCLIEHGAGFFATLAQGARASLLGRGEPAAGARLDRLLDDGFAGMLDDLATQPHCLVHGDLSCRNLCVQRHPARAFRPIDWEWAAIGVPAWDVTKLCAGWGSRKPALRAAYLEELERAAPGRIERAGFERSVIQCEALHAVWYLRWWVEGCDDPAVVDRLLDKLERGCAA